MKELFNNGISEVIYGNDLDVYTTNLSKFDRMMKESMEAQREQYKNTPMPVTSIPEPVADLKAKIDALQEEAKKQAHMIKQFRKAEVISAQKSKDVRIRSGMSKDKANHEFQLAVRSADNTARTKLAENKKMYANKIKQTLKSGLQENLDYLKQVKAEIQLRIQNVEAKVANTNDLMSSRKLSESAAQKMIEGYNKQIAQLINQMNQLTKRGQMSTIDIYLKLGVISSSTASRLRDQKNQQFQDEAKKLSSMKLTPKFTYDPIDSETGRRISKSDLDRHFVYLMRLGNKAEAHKVKKIMKNMRMPGATKTIEIEIKMIPKARKMNMLAGERVYSVTESERIPKNQHSLEIPTRSIAGEDQPSQRSFVPVKKPVTKSIKALHQVVESLRSDFATLYNQAKDAGKGDDIRLNLAIGNIRDLTNEVNQAKQTGKNADEIQNKLQMLREEYLKAMKDMKSLVRRS